MPLFSPLPLFGKTMVKKRRRHFRFAKLQLFGSAAVAVKRIDSTRIKNSRLSAPP